MPSLAEIRAEAEDRRRCPLSANATQVVFGEGAAGGLMLVGEQPGDVAAQGGWKDWRTLSAIYAKPTTRRERLSGAHLRAFDRAIEWARMGTNDERERVLATAEATENPPERGFPRSG